MKADISDAPERIIRRYRKPGVAFVAICVAVGSFATFGVLKFASRAPSSDSAYKHTIIPAAGEGRVMRASELPPGPNLDIPQGKPSSPVIYPPANLAGQTVFNDQNYVPRGADNVVSFRAGPDPYPRHEPPKPVRVTIVRQTPSMKDRVCWPHRQGSIEARNCRAWVGLHHRD